MKKILLSTLILFFVGSLSAQEVSVKWGDADKITSKSSSPDLIGKQDGKVFVLKSDNATNIGSYYINVYDAESLKKQKKIELGKTLPTDVKSNQIEQTLLLSDKILLISSNKNKELIATFLGFDGKIVKGKVVLDHVEDKDREFEGFMVKTSDDLSKIVSARKTKGKTKKSCAYSFTLFDTELKKINSNKQELPYEEDNFELYSTRLDNNGDVYMIARVKIEGSKRKYDTYKSILLNLNLAQKDAQINEVNLPFEKRIASSMSFFINSDNTITLLGLYATSKDADLLEGVFNIELEKGTFRVISSNYEKFLKGLQSREGSDDKLLNGVNYTYTLKNVFTTANEETLLVFESRLIYFRSTQSGSEKYSYTNDIIVIKLNKDNKIAWNTQIFKNQWLRIPYSSTMGIGPIAITVSTYRMYKRYEDLLSYACMYKNDKLYFVFNDHSKNMQTKSADKPFNSFKKTYCALVTLNAATGKWDKKTVFTQKDAELLITPQNSEQISDSEILTFSFGNDKTSGIGYLKVD